MKFKLDIQYFAQGTTDIGTKLMHAEITGDELPTAGFVQLVGVRSTSEKGSAPEQIENTELHEKNNSNLKGRGDLPNQVYTYNHTEENFTKVLAVTDQRHAYLEVFGAGDGYLIIGDGSTWHGGFSGPNTLGENTLEIVCEDIVYKTKAEVTELIGA